MLLDNVKRLCRERGITLWALEKATGIANGAIARWDSADPRIGTVKKVADFFGVSLDALMAPTRECSDQ